MNYWWVNQNQTYKSEINGGYLWSPKTKSNGGFNYFYSCMQQVMPGDVVFSFSDTKIKAVGIVVDNHRSSEKPEDFGSIGNAWSKDGWYVPVRFTELDIPIKPKEYIDQLRLYLPERYSPLQSNGNGNQAVYLTQISVDFALALIGLLDGQVENILDAGQKNSDDEANREVMGILDSSDIDVTERIQIILARNGQGIFRKRVLHYEKICRLTGIHDSIFLIASHIKPWVKCSSKERLDGRNGLLLSPHVDRLFDKGFMTFMDDGSYKLSSKLSSDILNAWGLSFGRLPQPLPLHSEQKAYMQFHREHVFIK